MHDVMRKRVMRKLEALPESQLYEVLDFIEFLEQRYASMPSPSATGFQRFAERLEDQMRLRSLAATTMNGTMKVVSVASKVIDGISGVFEGPATDSRPATDSTPVREVREVRESRSGAEPAGPMERPSLPRPTVRADGSTARVEPAAPESADEASETGREGRGGSGEEGGPRSA